MSPGAAKTIARLRRTRAWVSSVNRALPVQLLKTALLCLAWIGIAPMYVHFLSTYSGYLSAQLMVESVAIFGGIAVHLWPTRTPPWRTIAWAMIVMMVTGILSLSLGAGELSLTLVTLAGYAVILGRINSNFQRVWGLIRTWRSVS